MHYEPSNHHDGPGSGRFPREYIPKTLLRPFLPAAPVIVDCGANNGSDTYETALLWPDATIHAFEPVPAVYEQLLHNTKGLPNVHCYPTALGDRNGTASMHISSGGTDAASSLLAPKEHFALAPHVLFQETREVPCQTLDAWAEQAAYSHVDLLWLDMQGSELAMLQAAPRVLSTVRLIHMEVLTAELYENNPLLPEVQAWLETQGFRRRLLAVGPDKAGNAVFIRR